MDGIPATTPIPQKHQISAAVSTALPTFPTTISDVISQYAFSDYSEAVQPLLLDKEKTSLNARKTTR